MIQVEVMTMLLSRFSITSMVTEDKEAFIKELERKENTE